jgi:osmoprotectant transport system ATP-binding protein
MTSITFDEVSKYFPNQQQSAVESISFQGESGELVVLIGPSGSGKTTLLKMVNRLYEPTGGRIRIGEKDISSQTVTGLRRRIGYVIQQVGLFPHLTVEKNISIVPELVGWDRKRIEQRIEELLDLVRLPQNYRKRYPRQLSGGEQHRVGLARALAANPEILLMDEPFAAIDAINRIRLQDEMIKIQKRLHKTILFVTHDVDEALRLANRIAILKEGKLVQFAEPKEILTQPSNEFVSNLVGAKNVLRKLSLLDVNTVIEARPGRETGQTGNKKVTIHVNEDLRSALSRMLDCNTDELVVLDQDDHPIDRITFSDLQAVLSKKQ